MAMRGFLSGIVAAASMAAAAGCGSSGPSAPSGGTGNDGTIGATITITASGVSPKTVTVPLGSRVTFVNNDTRNHDMNSDPHPEHTSCPPLNVGFISAGQSRTSQNLTTARTCTYHDHQNPDNASLKGSVIIQ